ncbi:Flagellum-specific ATP synthase [Candidatus Trichorickettsia mobilis]|uniref:Flagellum-specific ATP synthase n=1 Tax=Candidatus Trichorickettsia mobilis TaxID=1346319 RepID=A0ABZ0UYD5_9RICK|nr:flagellar protein export ATPase FliI [Candidatus Trichorickettsia mobilis]WPY01079.1 Flagellum-specific ATP synthase [Candidatus Trichorickettsia mobilis]
MNIISGFECLRQQVEDINSLKIYGKVISIKGILIECNGINDFVAIGSRCKIRDIQKTQEILCEVVGFSNDTVLLMSFNDTEGIGSGALVEVYRHDNVIAPDMSWLGRIVNAFGEPIDELGPLKVGGSAYQLKAQPPASQKRGRIGAKIDLGVKVIDTFASCCYGQRMGIFAGSGVGKSVLISMLTKYAATDVKVIGLVGERSREVKEFIEEYLGADGLKQAVIVVATGDESALLRKRAAYTTMAIAEYFRDHGKEVLCIIDSITRFAMAQREIGLAIGEPPTTKGYTPSVFSELPKLLERAGPGVNGVNITGLFTVLVEGDDQNEPVSDTVRGTVDGHIVMDRSIAERGRFPAVDVLKSVSRAMPQCNSDLENRQVNFAKRMLSIYHDMAEMIRLGAYKKGADPDVDLAINYYNKLETFLSQKPNEICAMSESYQQLGDILSIKE